MRLESVTAEIRPRSDWEAVDLGFAMVRRDFWRCLALWWMGMLPLTLVMVWLLWDRPLLLLALFWWWKPAGGRMVLFHISRRLFGETPGWRAVWRELPRAWTRRFFHRFFLLRFSPWLPVTMAVEDLEGLRGDDYKQRVKQISRRGEGAVMWTYFTADGAAAWFGMAIFGFAAMVVPEGQDGAWTAAMEAWDISSPADIPLLISRTVAVCVMLAISLSDTFLTGVGFGIYVNNRTWVEGWDVELAFRRLGQRLAPAVAGLMVVLCLSLAGVGTAAAQDVEVETEGVEMLEVEADEEMADEESGRIEGYDENGWRDAGDAILEVKAAEEFVVHSKKVKMPVGGGGSISPVWAVVVTVLGYAAAAAVVGLIAWAIWKHRDAFKIRRGMLPVVPELRARVVMGMEVTPESLPEDVPSTAWRWWLEGRRHEALALLYRGAISRVIESSRVEILESDTEGDCLRRVEAVGAGAHPGYFRNLTGRWIGMAYANLAPADAEVEALCKGWPFAARKGGA